MKLRHVSDYRARRREKYPEVSEQLDALWKAVEALSKGEPIPADAKQVLDRVRAVKATFRKGAT